MRQVVVFYSLECYHSHLTEDGPYRLFKTEDDGISGCNALSSVGKVFSWNTEHLFNKEPWCSEYPAFRGRGNDPVQTQVIDTHGYLGGRSIVEATFVQGTKVALLQMSGQTDFSIDLTSLLEKSKSCEPEVRALRSRVDTEYNWNLHDRWKVVGSDTVELQTLRHFDRDEDMLDYDDDRNNIINTDNIDKAGEITKLTKKNLVTIYLRTDFWDSLGAVLQERKDNFLEMLSQGQGIEPGDFPVGGSEVTHSFPKTKDPQFTGLILTVSEAWMESAGKHPRLRTNLGTLRFFEKGYQMSDKVWSLNAQFIVKNRKRSPFDPEENYPICGPTL